jgi:hypothetical protein
VNSPLLFTSFLLTRNRSVDLKPDEDAVERGVGGDQVAVLTGQALVLLRQLFESQTGLGVSTALVNVLKNDIYNIFIIIFC